MSTCQKIPALLSPLCIQMAGKQDQLGLRLSLHVALYVKCECIQSEAVLNSDHSLYSHLVWSLLLVVIICFDVYFSRQPPHWWTWHLAPTSHLCEPVNAAYSANPLYIPCTRPTLGLLLPPWSNSLQHRHCWTVCSLFRCGGKYPFSFDHVLTTLAPKKVVQFWDLFPPPSQLHLSPPSARL